MNKIINFLNKAEKETQHTAFLEEEWKKQQQKAYL